MIAILSFQAAFLNGHAFTCMMIERDIRRHTEVPYKRNRMSFKIFVAVVLKK